MKVKPELSCRGCLTQVIDGDFYSLTFKKIKDLFVGCTSIEILPDDTERLPRQLCADCYSKCEQWHTFKNMCKEVNEKLHNSIQECVSGQNQEHLAISIKEEMMDTDCEGNFEVESFVIVGEVFKEEEEEADQEENTADEITVKEGERFPVRDMTICESPPRQHLTEHDSEKNLECFVKVERIACSPVVDSRVISLHTNDEVEDQPDTAKEAKKEKECPLCKKKTKLLLKHLTTVHLKPGQKECPLCMETFSNLTEHIAAHTGGRNYPCGICKKSFTFPSNRTRHWKNRHRSNAALRESIAVIQQEVVVVECPVCHKSFQGLAHLHTHFVTHTDEQPYICNYCNVINRYKSYIHKHIRSHHPNESVEKGLSIKEDSIFKNSRPWEAMGYFGIKRLTQEKTYNLQNYTCKTCGKVCRSPSSLIEHSLVHTGEKPFQCVYCPAVFTVKSSGLNHVSKYHPNESLTVVLKKGTNYAKELAKLKKSVQNKKPSRAKKEEERKIEHVE